MLKIAASMFLLLISSISYADASCEKMTERLKKELSRGSNEAIEMQSFTDCKVWPTDSRKSIVALASLRNDVSLNMRDGEGNGFYDLTVFIVKIDSGEILSRLHQEKAFKSDAIQLTGIAVDSAPYKLMRDERAFGVRARFSNSSTISSWEHEQLNLYVTHGATLKIVLERLITAKKLYEKINDCKESLVDINRVLILAASQSHGKADLILKEKLSSEKNDMVKSECVSEKKVSFKNYLLHFNGDAYVVPAGLQY